MKEMIFWWIHIFSIGLSLIFLKWVCKLSHLYLWGYFLFFYSELMCPTSSSFGSLVPLKSAEPLIGVFYQLSVHESVSWFKVNISKWTYLKGLWDLLTSNFSAHYLSHWAEREKNMSLTSDTVNLKNIF